jgi:hypothetical protein
MAEADKTKTQYLENGKLYGDTEVTYGGQVANEAPGVNYAFLDRGGGTVDIYTIGRETDAQGNKSFSQMDSTSESIAASLYGYQGYTPTPEEKAHYQTQQANTLANAGTPAPGTQGTPPLKGIQNPAQAPQPTGSGPTLPQPQGASASEVYTGSLTQNVDNQKKALQAEADKRAADYQAKISELEKKEAEYQAAEELGMSNMGEEVKKQAAEKRAALDLEKQRFDENYNANQALIGELDGLLTQGNQVIEQMKGTTGLASIMEPRIAKTMSDIQGRAGVIQAVLSARNGQMSYAQQQLASSLNAISSIYGDQIDYYKSVVSYYDDLKGDNQAKLNKLTSEQRDYLDVKLNLLENDLKNAQATYDYVKEAMLDPATAADFAGAGVSLTDSVPQINQKLAQYAYSQEVADISNKMAGAGYSTKKVSGATPVTIIDSAGKSHTYYKAPTAEEDGSFTLGTNQARFDSKGNLIAQGPDTKTNEMSELLSPTEAKSLGVPYGTTKGQAAQSAPKPAPEGYPTSTLSPGSGDTAGVMKLQQYLVTHGFMTQAEMDTGPGVYGPKTTAAVAKMQNALGVDNAGGEGVYGPKTLAALQGKVAPTTSSSKSTSSKSTGSSSSAAKGGTEAERKASTLSSYEAAFVPGAKMADGTPVLDQNGYVTPVAWKAAIADYPGSRSDFIKEFGYLIYLDKGKPASSYGLTATEAKLITT